LEYSTKLGNRTGGWEKRKNLRVLERGEVSFLERISSLISLMALGCFLAMVGIRDPCIPLTATSKGSKTLSNLKV
jgi:hypothetical protein